MSTNSESVEPTEGDQTRLPLPDFTIGADWHAAPDFHLQGLAELGSSIMFDVTLYLPCGRVSGMVITGEQYFEGSAELVRQAIAGKDANAQQGGELLIKGWIAPGAQANRPPKDAEDLVHQGISLTRFIHLQNALVEIGSTNPTRHPFLRVQLSHVSAWSFGSVN